MPQMLEVKKRLEALGHEVTLPPTHVPGPGGPITVAEYYQIRKEAAETGNDEKWIWDAKEAAMRLHLAKVADADLVLVVNEAKHGREGYVGANTLLEIGAAFQARTPTYLLHDLPQQDSTEELLGMRVGTLRGDLTMLPTEKTEKACDHQSAGVLTWRDGKLLLIQRGRQPHAWAPPAGHLDEDAEAGGPAVCASRELEEETGLHATGLRHLLAKTTPNPCRRGGTWHHWNVYEAVTEGEAHVTAEAKDVKWCTREELEALTARTEERSRGTISDEAWKDAPGLEAVWVKLLRELQVLAPQTSAPTSEETQ